MCERSSLFSKRFLIVSLCLVSFVVVFMFAFFLSRFDTRAEKALIERMKDLSYFEYFYYGNNTKISEITKGGGCGYGISRGLGSHFGQKGMSLWRGTNDIDSSLQLTPCYLLRISDNQSDISSQQYADLTISCVQNSADPNISDYVGTVGFSYDQDTYVVISNGQIYEVLDKSFFADLFSFLEDKDILPPKVD